MLHEARHDDDDDDDDDDTDSCLSDAAVGTQRHLCQREAWSAS